MAVEICPNEGKQYALDNVLSGATVYCGVIYGQTVAGGTITATSTLATLQEDTHITRVSAVLGAADATGVMAFPGVTMTAASGAQANAQAWFIATAATLGKALYIWDLSATRDMSVAGSEIIIPALNVFLKNPGE
jgi:hypothetical protein